MDTFSQEFEKQVLVDIRLLADGVNRFRVLTPFRFDDGDHLCIVLKKEQQQWILSDEGHTFMHLSYWIELSELNADPYKSLIKGTLDEFKVLDRTGELITIVNKNNTQHILFNYIQTVLTICSIVKVLRLAQPPIDILTHAVLS